MLAPFIPTSSERDQSRRGWQRSGLPFPLSGRVYNRYGCISFLREVWTSRDSFGVLINVRYDLSALRLSLIELQRGALPDGKGGPPFGRSVSRGLKRN